MMEIKKRIKCGVMDAWDRVDIRYKRYLETKKFQDPRRKAIYENVHLTREQEQQIDELYLQNYGEKIPYTWHRHFTAFTGKFDPEYLPELLFIPEFEHFMNPDRAYNRVLADKNLLSLVSRGGGVKTPHVYLSSTCGVLRDGDTRELSWHHGLELLQDAGEVFIKPTVGSDSGRGCFVACFEHGRDTVTGRTVEETLRSLGSDFAVQERIRCHESLARLYPGSANTFRIITYRWKDKIYHMPACLRIGQGGKYLDNAHAGGMFVAVDDDGMLGKTAFTEFLMRFEKHPDTGVAFDGYRIDLFPEVLRTAYRMCELIPQIGCIHWDITIDETGTPVVIEGNTRCGSLWLAEMPNGCGPFGERTAEILRWMGKMKRMKASERGLYRYGNNM